MEKVYTDSEGFHKMPTMVSKPLREVRGIMLLQLFFLEIILPSPPKHLLLFIFWNILCIICYMHSIKHAKQNIAEVKTGQMEHFFLLKLSPNPVGFLFFFWCCSTHHTNEVCTFSSLSLETSCSSATCSLVELTGM